VALGDGSDLGCSRRERLLEHRLRFCDGQDHPDRRVADDCFGFGVVLDPEGGFVDCQLSDHDVAGVVLEAVAFHGAESGRIKGNYPRAIRY